MDREYTQEVEENRRVLKPILRLARSLNKYKGKCKLDGDTLIIQGTKYTASTIHLLPPDLSGFHASSKSDDKTIAFFGELNPLSNFHPCRFALGNEEYHSSEQYIQQKKALFFGDETTAKRIMAANTAFDCLQLSKNVHGYDSEKWAMVAKEQVLPGIMSKFSSNPQLQDILLNTGKLQIVESSYDQSWGTGIPLQSKDCLKESLWANIGILGECLMEVRTELKQVEDANTEQEMIT